MICPIKILITDIKLIAMVQNAAQVLLFAFSNDYQDASGALQDLEQVLSIILQLPDKHSQVLNVCYLNIEKTIS
jgi:hypothetical protein